MNMGLELLIPGMQHSHKAWFPPEFIFTERYQCLRDGLKEDGEHHGFVLEDEGIELMGKGKYHMEVGNGQQFGCSFFKPSLSGDVLTFWAVPVTAGMIPDALSAALIAARKVAATRGGAAVHEVEEDPALIIRQGIYASIVSYMGAEDIC
jgi:hypothetical protein